MEIIYLTETSKFATLYKEQMREGWSYDGKSTRKGS